MSGNDLLVRRRSRCITILPQSENFDDIIVEQILATVQQLKVLNREIWDFLPFLQADLREAEREARANRAKRSVSDR